VRFLTPDIVIVVGVGGTMMDGWTIRYLSSETLHILVAIKQNINWRFTAFPKIPEHNFIGRPEEVQALTNELRQMLYRRVGTNGSQFWHYKYYRGYQHMKCINDLLICLLYIHTVVYKVIHFVAIASLNFA
jgi:hypothetical protein